MSKTLITQPLLPVVDHYKMKPPGVVKILFDNKVKLVTYLEGLHKERESTDGQYKDEKQLVISTLESLQIE